MLRGLAKPAAARGADRHPPDGRATSFFGDLHPSFFGNVVKAMASAKQGYPIVSRMLAKVAPASAVSDAAFFATLDNRLRATVERVVRLTPTIVEVVVRAPAAAARFEPGQFYRLQNYEALARSRAGTRLVMEGLALTGAWVDRERGLVSTIVLEMGGSSDLCAQLQPGEPVVLMGPTGTPTEIEPGETVVLVGGGLGNAVLFSIGQAFRRAGSKVLYFAGYKKMIDRYKVADIEAAADVVVWCCDEAPGFAADRPQDRAFVGNIVAGDARVRDRRARRAADRVRRLRPHHRDRLGQDDGGGERARGTTCSRRIVKPAHRAIGSINSPMQCMMKEICAQCLQPHRDPATGKVTLRVLVLQPGPAARPRRLSPALDLRLRQNAVQEKLTAQWIGRVLTAST